MSRLLEPKDALEVVRFNPGQLSDYGRELAGLGGNHELMALPAAARFALSLQAASFSDAYENKVLDHVLGKTELAKVTPIFLALTTVVPEDGKTGSTITEASYTGYARKSVAAADFNAAASGQSTNANAITFAACTAGSSTIIGWALCDAVTVGNVIFWGTTTSTVISTTQTPATVAVGGLVCNLD